MINQIYYQYDPSRREANWRDFYLHLKGASGPILFFDRIPINFLQSNIGVYEVVTKFALPSSGRVSNKYRDIVTNFQRQEPRQCCDTTVLLRRLYRLASVGRIPTGLRVMFISTSTGPFIVNTVNTGGPCLVAVEGARRFVVAKISGTSATGASIRITLRMFAIVTMTMGIVRTLRQICARRVNMILYIDSRTGVLFTKHRSHFTVLSTVLDRKVSVHRRSSGDEVAPGYVSCLIGFDGGFYEFRVALRLVPNIGGTFPVAIRIYAGVAGTTNLSNRLQKLTVTMRVLDSFREPCNRFRPRRLTSLSSLFLSRVL